jgi:2-methylisocitrate lyase-like PEP mutase family enzyme
MEHRRNRKRLLAKHKPLQLVATCDAFTAKLIEQAGFPAYEGGGFALDGSRFGFAHLGVSRPGEKSAAAREIIHAWDLPMEWIVMTATVMKERGPHDSCLRRYRRGSHFHGSQAIPENVGHTGGTKVIETKDTVNKIRAACFVPRDPEQLLDHCPDGRHRCKRRE